MSLRGAGGVRGSIYYTGVVGLLLLGRVGGARAELLGGDAARRDSTSRGERRRWAPTLQHLEGVL